MYTHVGIIVVQGRGTARLTETRDEDTTMTKITDELELIEKYESQGPIEIKVDQSRHRYRMYIYHHGREGGCIEMKHDEDNNVYWDVNLHRGGCKSEARKAGLTQLDNWRG